MRWGAVLLVLLSALSAQAAETIVTENPETTLKTWKKSEHGFSLELVQLLPEFVQATYSSRDLPPAIFDSMRGYCIFGTVARNESDAPLSYRVASWRFVTADGKKHRLRTKSQWVKVWSKLGADFSFSILPDDLTFEAGDWAQGFTTPKIAPGTRFDLIYTWRQHGKTYTGKLEKLACPSGSGIQ
ncbi:MAG: hypothetical protein HZA59_05070 [Hydrogenophilales bacterium]|nr:hypothetical protein [Hydrogenophilales bacterium]